MTAYDKYYEKKCYGCYSPGRCAERRCEQCSVKRSCQEDTYCERYDEDHEPPEREDDE